MARKLSKITLLILIFAFALTALLVPAQAFAASYIYNWGTRGEVATSLSDNAKAFYTGSYTFQVLANTSGGTSRDNAPNSALYKALKKLMTDNHSHITSYDETRGLYRYTDCQNGGGAISSFYSGKSIGPSWDGSWNREHTWPNSKGSGSAENDIMMLRPTSTSENSSRGNTAFGKSSGFYNPNSESNGKYDLRGDVSRICLYVYTRWGNTSYMWGASGVMESLEVLLEWMEADPVDTWEMGRNDAVESITGTRNAFVDYPEYAFLLFGEEVPTNYPTPSQSNGVTPPKPDPHTCDYTPATCTEPATCKICYATTGSALGHTAPNADGECTRCGEVLEVKTTHAGTQSDPYTVADALKVGNNLKSGTSNKVFVKGQVVNAGTVQNNTYRKGLEIKDSSTNETLYINTANPKTTAELNLSVGNTILLEGYIRINNTTQKPEMGTGPNKTDYTYYSIVDAGQGGGTTHTCVFGQATCTKPATCSCGATQGSALGHTTTNGTCTRCGITVGGGSQGGGTVTQPSGDTIEVTFQNSTGSTTLAGTGDVSFTASRAVDNWDDNGRGLQFLKENGDVSISSATSVSNVSSITLDISENKDIAITVTVKVGDVVLTCNGQNSASVGKGANQTVTFTANSAVSGIVTIKCVPAQSGTSGLGSIYLAGVTITTSSGSQGGGTVTPPVVTPDTTVTSFKSAVADIQSATTMDAKFTAIKTAVELYNAMNAEQKAQVTAEFNTLKAEVNNYNSQATTQNTNSGNAIGVAVQIVSLTVALAVALVLLKKVF
ncbi:MAG: endonuclease [Clostridia bacterium]|nr:endonuclease [Clostridia bacterium]